MLSVTLRALEAKDVEDLAYAVMVWAWGAV